MDVYDPSQEVSTRYANTSEGVDTLWQALQSRSNWAVGRQRGGNEGVG